jgi:SET domain-containing protein
MEKNPRGGNVSAKTVNEHVLELWLSLLEQAERKAIEKRKEKCSKTTTYTEREK